MASAFVQANAVARHGHEMRIRADLLDVFLRRVRKVRFCQGDVAHGVETFEMHSVCKGRIRSRQREL